MILHKDLSYAVIGAAMEVYNKLGCGFLEKVYQEALALELTERNISFAREKELEISYKGHSLKCPYYCDFLIDDKIILELKAVDEFAPVHKAQVINYLKATNLHLGILINFGASSFQYERLVRW